MIFSHPIDHIDFERKIAYYLNTETNNLVEIPYKTLWGADGSNSRVRREVERVTGNPSKTVKFSSGYQEFEILPKDGKQQLKVQKAFHVWPRHNPTFFIALPNADNTYTCTLFNPVEGSDHIMGWTNEQVLQLFKTQFPDAYAVMGPEKILEDHKVNPFGHLFSVDTPVWNYKGEVLLIGDAAHGVVPFYGLGINAGFEGVRHMTNLMDRSKRSDGSYDFEKVFKAFNGFKPATDALCAEAIANAHELHEAVGDPHFLFEKAVERELEKKFPNNFIEGHALLSFTNVPMDVCSKRMKIQREIAVELCKGKSKLTEVDWERAEKIVLDRLGENLFAMKPWYEEKSSL